MPGKLFPRRFAFGLVGAALTVPLLVRAAVSKTIEETLTKLEKYFQPMGEPAPEFTLQDSNGRPVGLQDLRRKVVALNFIYTRCPDVCPLQTERMALIQHMINPTPLHDQVRLVSITADPVHDTPDVMKAYGAAHGLDSNSWLFLTSGPEHPDTTRELSARYHNRYALEPDGSIMHGTVFHVIDGNGRWRGNFHGLEWDPAHLVLFIRELADQQNGTSSKAASSFWMQLEHLFW